MGSRKEEGENVHSRKNKGGFGSRAARHLGRLFPPLFFSNLRLALGRRLCLWRRSPPWFGIEVSGLRMEGHRFGVEGLKDETV